ncbi:MAG: DegT/DnrJ/EryC1/StrS family aminotransferase [Ruminococcaceae bacterium]|nr:DegT/DnrJ/EryC1/StrS family aminotransferase [Oscillospiraceae bacterium]
MYRMGQEELDAMKRAMDTKQLFRGNEIAAFEHELAEVIGTKHALAVSGGTGALIAAMVGAGIGPGDEVIVPGYTFMATAMAVLATGAIPVLAECDETCTIDVEDVEKKITKYTKAVAPVHICGFPANLDGLKALADKYGILIIEDACQADGGSYKGQRLGSIGDAGAFSFNFFKVISFGEGGGVVTNNDKIYERALIYHDGGAAFRPYAGELHEPVFCGTQLRVGELFGAFMRVQLTRMDGILNDLRAVKKLIMSALSGVEGIAFAPSHDIEGDCGTTLPFRFATEEKARDFAAKISGTVNGWLPIDSGKHVYYNWDPVIAQRGGHCDAVNPYLMPQNANLNLTKYDKNSLPKTNDILSRTVYISLNPDWDINKINEIVDACKAAVK